MQVKDLLKEKKPIDLMTPSGFIYLTVEKQQQIINGEISVIHSNPGCSGSAMEVEVEEILNYELIRGGLSKKDVFEYLADYARDVVKVNIPCIINGKETTITEVFNHPYSGFRCMADGEEYPLSAVYDKVGKPVINYAEEENWYFDEWFRCMKKKAETGRTEYCFTETGLEYWFQKDGFRRHYTNAEG